ncbi:hypothetical protein [Fulvimarina sp. MAC3]|uniref:hypothetical protein n=1 Tax=Fulvimarina sp. MAC3 TaxID=3148887 RepID=UPI0031FDC46F
MIDTHVLIWWFFEPQRLSDLAKNVVADDENTILVSPMSGFEIAQKHRVGKLPQVAAVLYRRTNELTRWVNPRPANGSNAARAAGDP